MSSNGNQQLDNDGLDLRQLFEIIWFHKFSLLIFVFLSVPLSVMVSTSLKPTYKAETVFERPRNNSIQGNTPLSGNYDGLGLLGFLSSGPVIGASGSFFSEIRSESFLKTVILNNSEFDAKKLQEMEQKSDI